MIHEQGKRKEQRHGVGRGWVVGGGGRQVHRERHTAEMPELWLTELWQALGCQ